MTKTISRTRTAQRTHRRSFRLTAEQKYYIAQKLLGAVVTIAGIWAGIAMQSFPVLLVGILLGAAFLFSKDKILMIGEVYWNENPKKPQNPSNSVQKRTEYTCENNKDML